MSERIAVALPDGRDYPILLGNGLLGTPGLLEAFTGSQVLIVSNPAVARLYLDRTRQSLGHADRSTWSRSATARRSRPSTPTPPCSTR